MRAKHSFLTQRRGRCAPAPFGVLIGPMLVADELARGELVVACARPLSGERNYYLLTPERSDQRPLLKFFSDWLLGEARRGSP